MHIIPRGGGHSITPGTNRGCSPGAGYRGSPSRTSCSNPGLCIFYQHGSQGTDWQQSRQHRQGQEQWQCLLQNRLRLGNLHGYILPNYLFCFFLGVAGAAAGRMSIFSAFSGATNVNRLSSNCGEVFHLVNTAVNCSPWAVLSVMRNLRGTGVGLSSTQICQSMSFCLKAR